MEDQQMGVLKGRGQSSAEDTSAFSGNAMDQPAFVLDREQPGGKSAVRTFRPCSLDFGSEHIDQFRSIRGSCKPGRVEAGCSRLGMDAGHESRNSISFRDRDIANIGGLEQGKIALLSILPRSEE